MAVSLLYVQANTARIQTQNKKIEVRASGGIIAFFCRDNNVYAMYTIFLTFLITNHPDNPKA